jgi:predicted acylesterase/phospholipase RssA
MALPFALALAACATLRKAAPPELAATGSPGGLPASVRYWAGDSENIRHSSELWQRLTRASAHNTITTLALSSGGVAGTFGAGVLVGLAEAQRLPSYTLVTGVSSGALLAPFAFLGPSWCARLPAVIEDIPNIPLRRALPLRLLANRSVSSNRPLDARIQRVYTNDMIAAIAAESARGRTLLVGTFDLDAEQFVIWDMGAIAERGDEAARSLFRTILLASASLPGFLPPILIPVDAGGERYEEMHVDGGLAAPFFVALPDEDAAKDSAQPLPNIEISLILNRKLNVPMQSVPQRMIPVLVRSIYFRNRQFNRRALEALDQQVGALGLTLRVTNIPLGYPLRPLDFSAPKIHELFEYGRRCAKADRVWHSPSDALAPQSSGQLANTQDADCPAAPND